MAIRAMVVVMVVVLGMTCGQAHAMDAHQVVGVSDSYPSEWINQCYLVIVSIRLIRLSQKKTEFRNCSLAKYSIA